MDKDILKFLWKSKETRIANTVILTHLTDWSLISLFWFILNYFIEVKFTCNETHRS